VTRGNFSEVEGGKRAIIRGVVKVTPGDIQQKKQLQKTLENRTRAIGIGLAVVTGGLGMHALLMNSNTFGYRQGLGGKINQATRAGVSRVLDSIPVLGAQRAATRAAVGANLGAAAARASATSSQRRRHPRHHSAERHRPRQSQCAAAVAEPHQRCDKIRSCGHKARAISRTGTKAQQRFLECHP
jgi:hypothetical protein